MFKDLLLIASLHFLAMITPGPDIVLVIRTALLEKRSAALKVVLGITAGICFHLIYCLVGLALLLKSNLIALALFQSFSGAYLVYLGLKQIRTLFNRADTRKQAELNLSKTESYFFQALLTNIFNPKVTLFFLSLFGLVIKPETPTWVQLIYCAEMILATLLWFGLISLFLSSKEPARKYGKILQKLEPVFGVLFLIFGLRLIFSGLFGF